MSRKRSTSGNMAPSELAQFGRYAGRGLTAIGPSSDRTAPRLEVDRTYGYGRVLDDASLELILIQRLKCSVSHFKRAWSLYRDGKYSDALAHYVNAITDAPQWYEPHYHAAACCHMLRRYGEANMYYEQALQRKTDSPLIWYHYAKALKDSGELDAAKSIYEQALRLDPTNDEIRYSRGLLNLISGEWLAGWPDYEYRIAGSDRAGKDNRLSTSLLRWQPNASQSVSGIIVYSEQGIGDTIMCWRYIALLRKRFSRVKVLIHAPLVRLMADNAAPDIAVAARINKAIDETGFSHYVEMMSLPGCFDTTPQTVPWNGAYLRPQQQDVARWSSLLEGERRLKVGVVWKGGQLSHVPGRDIGFEHLKPLLSREEIRWISLQKDEAPCGMVEISDWMMEAHDMADTAALIANLDLVIAVDTAVAHLAGAMGKPVWLLNRYESEWRWMHGTTTTPWYPSMRIFRQPSPGDWTSVIEQVSIALTRQNLTSNPTENPMKTFLHIGCGPKRKDQTTRGFNTDEWRELRLDIDERVAPDIVGTMTDMSSVASGSIDAIFSSHNIEHLYPHEVPGALKEFLRVLKPDGFLVVTCPDLQEVCRLVAEDKLLETAYTSPAGPIAPVDILYGHRPAMARGNLFMAHRCGFTRRVLDGTLRGAGFSVIASTKRGHPAYDLWAIASASNRSEHEMLELAKAHFPA